MVSQSANDQKIRDLDKGDETPPSHVTRFRSERSFQEGRVDPHFWSPAAGICKLLLAPRPIGLALSYKGRYCNATRIQRPAAHSIGVSGTPEHIVFQITPRHLDYTASSRLHRPARIHCRPEQLVALNKLSSRSQLSSEHARKQTPPRVEMLSKLASDGSADLERVNLI